MNTRSSGDHDGANNSLSSALPSLNSAGVEARQDGDVVRIEECAPLSKLKSWRVLDKVS